MTTALFKNALKIAQVTEFVLMVIVTAIHISLEKTAPSQVALMDVLGKVIAYPENAFVMKTIRGKTAQSLFAIAMEEVLVYITKNVFVIKVSTASTAKNQCAKTIAI